jgi:FkbM family methyltransferase
MYQFLKRILPARARRILRPLAIAYQRRTEVPLQRKLFANFIAPGDLVFDIGANSGRMTDLFLGLGARVVAVEPQIRVFARLYEAHAMNKRAHLLQCGVGAEISGMAEINICGDVDEVSSFDPKWETIHHAAKFTEKCTVEMFSLQALIATYGIPAYCKIDVEGWETKVLAGLMTPVPYLSFEIHTHHPDEPNECFRLLAALGKYRFNFVPHEHQAFQTPGWFRASDLMDYINTKGWKSGDVFCKLES